MSGSDLKSGVRYFMADYKAEHRELDETFSDSHYLLDEPKACFQIHFQYDFPAGYVVDAIVRSQPENPREEVRNDAIRERNVMGQGLKIGNNERRRKGRERKREREFTCKGAQHKNKYIEYCCQHDHFGSNILFVINKNCCLNISEGLLFSVEI